MTNIEKTLKMNYLKKLEILTEEILKIAEKARNFQNELSETCDLDARFLRALISAWAIGDLDRTFTAPMTRKYFEKFYVYSIQASGKAFHRCLNATIDGFQLIQVKNRPKTYTFKSIPNL